MAIYTDEQIFEEILNFLEFRKTIMKNPYVIVGERFKDMLEQKYILESKAYLVEDVNGNYRFTSLEKEQVIVIQ